MINLLSFVVILFRGKSKPLHVSMQVFRARKTHKNVSYITHPITVNSESALPEKKHILRPHFITNTINDGQQDNRHREIL